MLAIEVQNDAKWDFGGVYWENVIIVSKTKKADWCTMYVLPCPNTLLTLLPLLPPWFSYSCNFVSC